MTGSALAALGAAAARGDCTGVALAAHDAALDGATRAEVAQAIAAGAAQVGDGDAGQAPNDSAWMTDVAEALGGALLAEEGIHVRLLNSAAQQALGADFAEGLTVALERLTRSGVHHVDVAALLARARQRGSAWRRVDQQLVWAQRTALGLLVFVQNGISRSSAPPPDQDAAFRHELGNAMTAIAALAAQAQGEGSEAAALRALARIRRVADSAVDDVGHKGAVVMPGSREISGDIKGMVDDLAPFAEQRRVAVEARVEPGVLSRVPASTLRLVVWNLLKNAIEASPVGAGVVVTADYRDANLRLTVEDRGAGLPAALRERIFEPHFSTKDDGRGLGLSLVQDEVRRLGGHVAVGAAPRGGTRFVVTLPGAARSEPLPAPGEAESSGVLRKSPLTGVHIALICNFVFLERALSAFGATVTRTSEAELASSETVSDVLVVDGNELSAEAAARLRRLGRTRRVIFLAPEGTPRSVEGVDAVLAHSFDLSDLATTLEALLTQDSEVG